MTATEVHAIAQKWVDAWNTHDLEAILALYSDDVEMRSPHIAGTYGRPGGVLVGKDQVRRYWRRGLDRFRLRG